MKKYSINIFFKNKIICYYNYWWNVSVFHTGGTGSTRIPKSPAQFRFPRRTSPAICPHTAGCRGRLRSSQSGTGRKAHLFFELDIYFFQLFVTCQIYLWCSSCHSPGKCSSCPGRRGKSKPKGQIKRPKRISFSDAFSYIFRLFYYFSLCFAAV